jgi:hypothetical protein
MVDLPPYIEPDSGNHARRAGRGNQGGVVTIRQLLLVIHYRHDGWVWGYSAGQTAIKDFRNFDCIPGVNTDGHRYRGCSAGRNRSFEDRWSLISACVSFGLLRTSPCPRLQRARKALICGVQAATPFWLRFHCLQALLSLLRNQNKNHAVLDATKFVHNTGSVLPA